MSFNQIRENVWVGSWQPARDPSFLTSNRIASILNVAIDCDDPEVGLGIRRYHIPMIDGPGNPPHVMEIAIATMVSLLRAKENIYIHCVAGHSRSVYVLAKALEIVEGKPYQQIFDEIRIIRPEITFPERLRLIYG